MNELIELYYNLGAGDIIKSGDEAYTWAEPECLTLGWIKLSKHGLGSDLIGKPYNRNLVKIRRRRERTKRNF